MIRLSVLLVALLAGGCAHVPPQGLPTPIPVRYLVGAGMVAGGSGLQLGLLFGPELGWRDCTVQTFAAQVLPSLGLAIIDGGGPRSFVIDLASCEGVPPVHELSSPITRGVLAKASVAAVDSALGSARALAAGDACASAILEQVQLSITSSAEHVIDALADPLRPVVVDWGGLTPGVCR